VGAGIIPRHHGSHRSGVTRRASRLARQRAAAETAAWLRRLSTLAFALAVARQAAARRAACGRGGLLPAAVTAQPRCSHVPGAACPPGTPGARSPRPRSVTLARFTGGRAASARYKQSPEVPLARQASPRSHPWDFLTDHRPRRGRRRGHGRGRAPRRPLHSVPLDTRHVRAHGPRQHRHVGAHDAAGLHQRTRRAVRVAQCRPARPTALARAHRASSRSRSRAAALSWSR
jgi:hypothetical protein